MVQSRLLGIEKNQKSDLLALCGKLVGHFIRHYTVDTQTAKIVRPIGLDFTHFYEQGACDLFEPDLGWQVGCVWWRRGAVRREDFLRSVPFFVLSLVFGLVTIWFHHYRALGGRQFQTGGFASRLAVAGWAPWFYLYKALVPLKLTAVYPKWPIDASDWLVYLPGTILVGCLALFWWKRRELLSQPMKTWWPGLLLVALGLALHIIGYVGQQTRICIVGLFTVKPMKRMKVNVEMIEAGMATPAITVLRQSRMKKSTVSATSAPVNVVAVIPV